MEIELDSPLHLDFDAQLELNGRKLLTSHGCSVCYNPCLPDGMRNDLEAKWVVKHYALNPAYGWVIFRNAFPWAGQLVLKSKRYRLRWSSIRYPSPALIFGLPLPVIPLRLFIPQAGRNIF